MQNEYKQIRNKIKKCLINENILENYVNLIKKLRETYKPRFKVSKVLL